MCGLAGLFPNFGPAPMVRRFATPLSIRGHSYDLCRAVVFHVVFMESCVSRLLSSARRRLGCREYLEFLTGSLPWALSRSNALAGLRAQHDSASASEPALRPPQRKRKKRKLLPQRPGIQVTSGIFCVCGKPWVDLTTILSR